MKHDATIFIDINSPEYLVWNRSISDVIVQRSSTICYGFEYFLYLDEFEDQGHLEIHILNNKQFAIFCIKYGLDVT